MTVLESMESPTLKIKLIDLKNVTERLFDHIMKIRGEQEVEIDKSFYWNIPLDELFDMDKKPIDFDIGSLSDDWDFLSGLLEEDTIPVARQLTELSALFRIIGEKLGDKLASEGG